MEARRITTFLLFATLIAVSLVVCIVAFLLLAGNSDVGGALLMNFLVSYPMCLLLSVLDYKMIAWLSTTAPLRRRQLPRLLVDWLVTSIVGAALSLAVRQIVGSDADFVEGAMTFLVWNSIVVLGIELFLYQKNIAEKETQLARIEREKAVYQYEALKNQMNPHFLFNSLNALASLAYQDSAKANLFAKKLSCVYRYLLSTYERPLVALKEELDFLDSYLFLEKIRFGDAFIVSRDIDDGLLSRRVVPAALQTLVENALKHNVCTVEKPLRISVRTEGAMLVVENNLQLRDGVVSTGVGLENLRRQYVAHAKDIAVSRTPTAFIVAIPLLS